MPKNQGDLGPTIYSIARLTNLFNDNDCIAFKRQLGNRHLKTGFDQFDNYGWFYPGNLIVFASPPAMGKTAFCLTIINQLTNFGENKVRYFSMGENASDIFERLIINHTEKIPTTILKELNDPEKGLGFLLTIKEMMTKKVIIDEEKFHDYTDLVERIKHDQLTQKSSVYFIDNFQDFRKGGKSKREMNHYLKVLKQIAIDFNCIIVLLSRISSSFEKRKTRKPKLSDLTALGAFDLYSDFIGFIYRPEYYGICETKKGRSTAGKMTLYCKHSAGRKNNYKFQFQFDHQFHRFKEIDFREY